MGCCMSTPSGSNSPYSGGGGSGSARAINEPQQTPGISPSQAGGGGVDDVLPSPSSADPRMRHHHRHHHHHHQPLAQHINKPLRRHEWSSRNRLWTRAALTRERAEFFDTRVTGRQEIWQTLRAALEALWEADIAAAAAVKQQQQTINSGDDVLSCQSGSRTEVEDPAIALATAQSILTAADITLPTGDLAQGAYDSLGNYYSLPEYVVSDPSNIVVRRPGGQKTTEEDMDDMKADLTVGEETAEDDLDVMDPDKKREEAERRREEKGKAVAADVRDQVVIRARLSDGSRDVNVSVGKGETVRSIARHIADEAKLAPNKKVRIAYMGKILKENLTLPTQGWKQGHVLNALVFNR
ncbi:hypothetical protein V8F33_009958 [Rhypophila sp. PSN 637]